MNKKNKFKYISIISFLLLSGCSGSGMPHFNADGDAVVNDKNHVDMSQTGINAGDQALSEGKYAIAAQMYGRAWDMKKNPDTAIRYGHALRLSGDYEKSVIMLKAAAERYPDNIDVLTELARNALAGGFSDTAKETLQQASRLKNKTWDFYMTYGAYFAREGNYSEARNMFEKAVSISDSDYNKYSAQSNIALVDIQSGNKEQGIEELKAVAHQPGVNPKIHANLALIQGLRGDNNDYLIQAEKANMSPSDIKSIQNWINGDADGETTLNASGNTPISDSKGQILSIKKKHIVIENKETINKTQTHQTHYNEQNNPNTSQNDIMSSDPDSLGNIN